MVVNVLLCFVCRHNRRRTFRTYSLLLTPCSLSTLTPYPILLAPFSSPPTPLLLAPYSLHLTPLLFSLYFLSPFSFVVREARLRSLWQKPTTRGQTQAESVVARTRGQPKKEFRIEFSFFRGVLAGIWGDVV